MPTEIWTMPTWMESYREAILNTGGNSIEDLMNDHDSNLFNNSVRVTLCVAVKSQVGLLEILHDRGLLMPPVPQLIPMPRSNRRPEDRR